MSYEINMVACHNCKCEDDEGAFHEIDNTFICDECYERDQPYKCVDCEYESYDRDLFHENRNEDYECCECRESGRRGGTMNFYMCSY